MIHSGIALGYRMIRSVETGSEESIGYDYDYDSEHDYEYES